jgi:hypothetical protein
MVNGLNSRNNPITISNIKGLLYFIAGFVFLKDHKASWLSLGYWEDAKDIPTNIVKNKKIFMSKSV